MNKDVVSLEIAKELQEAGYTSECEYWWTLDEESALGHMYLDKFLKGLSEYPAPTATQLAEELPHGFSLGKTEDGKPFCGIYTLEVEHGIEAKTFPDALGKTMVYLLKNKLI